MGAGQMIQMMKNTVETTLVETTIATMTMMNIATTTMMMNVKMKTIANAIAIATSHPLILFTIDSEPS